MPKSKKRKKPNTQSQTGTKQSTPLTRRDWLSRLSWYGAGALVLGGGGVVFARDVKKKMKEQDLSVIGQGTPVVLQIHDPACSLCAALQKQTRKALRSFDDADVLYRVANIRTEEGAAWQRKEALPHVTLVLYNGRGERVHSIEGVTSADTLIDEFEAQLSLAKS